MSMKRKATLEKKIEDYRDFLCICSDVRVGDDIPICYKQEYDAVVEQIMRNHIVRKHMKERGVQ